ncbi:MAG: hypothetical protein RLT30_12320, partial [Gammaproteobacteria bacterium]
RGICSFRVNCAGRTVERIASWKTLCATRINEKILREAKGQGSREKFSWVLLYEKKYLALKAKSMLKEIRRSKAKPMLKKRSAKRRNPC